MKKINEISRLIIAYLITAFVFVMVGIFPLYYDDKYYNMGEAKYIFVKNLSLGIFLPLLIILGVYLVGSIYTKIKDKDHYINIKGNKQFKRKIKNQVLSQEQRQVAEQEKKIAKKQATIRNVKQNIKQISIVDWFVLAYAIVVTISYIVTPYKETGLWGYVGWYLGLMTQWLFVLIYFFSSRFIKCINWIVVVALTTSFPVFILAILQRFQIDPLNMYEELSIYTKMLFLTTIGQATWYSSYLCIVFPIGLFLFWNSQKLYQRVILGVYVFTGFGTIVTQNSDSAFFAVGIMLFVLFCFSFSNFKKFKNFLEVLLLALVAFKLIGILQVAFPVATVPLDALFIFFSQSNIMMVALIFVTIFYIAVILWERQDTLKIISNNVIKNSEVKNNSQNTKWQLIPKVSIVIVVIALAVVLIIIYLTTTKQLPPFLDFFYGIGYFTFDDMWGNGRGFTWKLCAQIFQEYPLVNKLFGCGPDCFVDYSYARYETAINSMWEGNVLTNAHNEWFTSLLFFGITGFITYTGIFISQVVLCLRDCKKNPYLIVVAICILSYIGHNIFCYQQIVCTPLIFIVIGVGEFMRRDIRAKAR